MANLPEPDWLTLPETLAWLEKRGILECDAKISLPRAFRDEQIHTRGRSRKYTGHDTQTELDGISWDRAKVFWEENFFAIPDSRGYAIDIQDVQIYRSDLVRWISESENDKARTSAKAESAAKTKRTGRNPKYDWDAFYTEIVVRADLDGLPETQAELESDMASWCLETWGDQPGESTIRSKISPIYNHARKQGQ